MALRLDHVRVRDVMHNRILSCAPVLPLSEVAAIMATNRVHAVAITETGASRPVGVVSDREVVAAVAAGARLSAGEAASSDQPTVSANERVRHAAQLMSERGVSHLIVVDAAGGFPVGIVSTLDIAAIYAQDVEE